MKKNELIIGTIILILVAALGYWLGYSAGSVHRFIQNTENVRVALDSKTGQACVTVPHPFDSEASLPKCKDLK